MSGSMMKVWLFAAVALVFSWISPSHGQGSGPECVCLQEIADARDFRSPLIVINAEDGTDRLFIGEQVGVLWTFLRDDSADGGWSRLDQPFLNISVFFGAGYDERGFLATRFHPNHVSNGLLYAYYSLRDGVNLEYTRLAEYRVDPDNPNIVDPSYERVILDLEQPYDNHNGGEIWFDDSGFLLLSLGDGGSAGDPEGHGQNLETLLGSIIRIDVDNPDPGAGLEYSIPPDNPYLNVPSARPELYAVGLRNPWRVFVDQTAEFGTRYFIGDVGQNAWEEIDILQPTGEPKNYGWAGWEADECFNTNICEDIEAESIFPIDSYSHQDTVDGGQSIILGPMYRGCENPNYEGWLFFGDYDNGNVFGLVDQGLEPRWTNRLTLPPCDASVCPPPLVTEWPAGIVTFGVDERREMYMGASGNLLPPNVMAGRVYKFVDPSNPGEPCDLRKK